MDKSKTKKRLLSLLLTTSLIITSIVPVFAGTIEGENRAAIQSTMDNISASALNRVISTNKIGYKIELFYSTDGRKEIAPGDRPFEGNGGITRFGTLLAVKKNMEPDAVVSMVPTTYEQEKELANWQKAVSTEDYSYFGGYGGITDLNKPKVRINKIILPTKIGYLPEEKTIGLRLAGNGDKIVERLGNWQDGTLDSTAKAQLNMGTGADTLLEHIIKDIIYEDPSTTLTSASTEVLSAQDPEIRELIASAVIEAGADYEALKKYTLPQYPECAVAWGIYITPLVFTYTQNGGATILDSMYNKVLISANTMSFMNGAVKQFAIETRDRAIDEGMTVSPSIAEAVRWGEMGYSLNSIIYNNLPNSIFPIADRWGLSAGVGVAHTNEFETAFSQGVGLFWNTAKIPETPTPCCNSVANPSLTSCPCGGAGSPRCDTVENAASECQEGCTCGLTGTYPDKCGCAPEKEILDESVPTILEDHLSQTLERTANGIPTTTPGKAFTISYKPVKQSDWFWDETKSRVATGKRSVTDSINVPGCGDAYGHAAYTAGLIPVHRCIQNTADFTQEFTTKTVTDVKQNYSWTPTYQDLKLTIPFKEYSQASLMNISTPFGIMKQGDSALISIRSPRVTDTVTLQGKQNVSIGDNFIEQMKFTWVGHRWGITGTENYAVLAKYMTDHGTAANNERYKNFMNSAGYTGTIELNDGSKIARQSSGATTTRKFNMSFNIGGSGDLVGSSVTQLVKYTPVNGTTEEVVGATRDAPDEEHPHASSPQTTTRPSEETTGALQTAITNRFNFTQEIGVHPIYKGKAVQQNLGDGKSSSVHTYGGGDVWTFTTPSNTLNFYPTYAMKANYEVEGADNQVYMLSQKARSFKAIDKLTIISSPPSGQDITAPWSRDAEDASSRTMKAGNAYEYKFGSGTVTVKGNFHLLDPNFSANPAATTAQNTATIKKYTDQFNAIASGFGKDKVAIYSNLTNASSSGSSFTVSGRNSSGKEPMTYKTQPVTSASPVNISYSYLPGRGLYPAGKNRSFMGKGVTAGDPLGTNGALVGNLESNGGLAVEGWYNEDFQGIIVAEMTMTLNVSNISTNFAEVYKYQSDWQTASNASAQQIMNQTVPVLSGMYGIGTQVKLGEINWGAAGNPNVVMFFPPTTFSVRGSVFDTAG